MAARKVKKFEDLTFTDDFMFCKVLQNDPAICKEMTELILGEKIGDIVQLEKQHPIELTSDGRGVRVDVYLKDDKNTVADIEMQTITYPNLPKRARYYLSMMDEEALGKGCEYSELPQSYVIFICLENPFPEAGLHKYSFTRSCKEKRELELEDATQIVFLSAQGKTQDISKPMECFLTYLSSRQAEDDFTKKLDRAVHKARTRPEWSREYMTLYEVKKMEFEAGKEEGKAEGIVEGQAKMLIKLVQEGLLQQDVAEKKAEQTCGINKKQFREMLKEAEEKDQRW